MSQQQQHRRVPFTREERRFFMAAVAKEAYVLWANQRKKQPLYIQDIVVKAYQAVNWLHYTKKWKGPLPQRRSLERIVNYCADEREYPESVPPFECVYPGYYVPNRAVMEGAILEEANDAVLTWKADRHL